MEHKVLVETWNKQPNDQKKAPKRSTLALSCGDNSGGFAVLVSGEVVGVHVLTVKELGELCRVCRASLAAAPLVPVESDFWVKIPEYLMNTLFVAQTAVRDHFSSFLVVVVVDRWEIFCASVVLFFAENSSSCAVLFPRRSPIGAKFHLRSDSEFVTVIFIRTVFFASVEQTVHVSVGLGTFQKFLLFDKYMRLGSFLGFALVLEEMHVCIQVLLIFCVYVGVGDN